MRVFIAGPRAISKLNKRIEERLHNIYSMQMTVIVGDANGIDKADLRGRNEKFIYGFIP